MTAEYHRFSLPNELTRPWMDGGSEKYREARRVSTIMVALALAVLLVGTTLASGTRPSPRFLDKTSALHVVGRARDRGQRAESVMLPRWASGLHVEGRGGAPTSNRVLRPADFGADPSGKLDSLRAFEAVIKAAWSSPSGEFTNGPDTSAIIDLEGGTYMFSAPLVFPAEGGGGIAMRDGVIRAAPTFPMDNSSALLMLTATNASSADDSACCWYEFMYFTNLVLDGSLRTGCARVHGATRIVFDETFFTGYRTTGLYYGSPSHQLLLTRSFFGTSDWRGLPGEHEVCETLSHAWQNIGLHLDGPDNQIEDSVFFCSGIGIKLTGSANYFEGIHAFTGAAATYPLGAVYVPAKGASDNTAHGEKVEGMHGNRFTHCYWDYSGIRIENPLMIEFSNNYIIGLPSRQPNPAFVEFVAVGGAPNISISGVRFTGCVFRSAGAHSEAGGVLTAFKLNETNGQFARHNIVNSLIEGNSYQAVKGAATRVQKSVWQHQPTTTWTFDLCDDILFGNMTASDVRRTADGYTEDIFAHLQFSVRVQDSSDVVAAAITSVDGCAVSVTTAKPVSGVVYLTADQSRDDNACHGSGCHVHALDGIETRFL